MGQIRQKQTKNQTYFYYSRRVRSQVTGKVKSIDYCLGKEIFCRYLRSKAIAYFVWNDDIKLDELIEAAIRYQFKDQLDDLIWSIDWRRKKIRLRSRRGSHLDCRKWRIKYYRKQIENLFTLNDEIEATVLEIQDHYRTSLEDCQTRKKYQDEAAKLLKKRKYEEASFYEDLVNSYADHENFWFESYQRKFEALIKAAPRSIRGEIQRRVELRIERTQARKAIA